MSPSSSALDAASPLPRRTGLARSPGRPRFALLALAVVLSACSRPAPTPEPVRAVRTLTVGAETAQMQHEFAGEVRARTESRLSFRVGGKMVERVVEPGQRVKAGQVLARLDPGDLQLAVRAGQAQVAAAQASLDLAAADLKRFRELREQGFISAADLERRETAWQAQKAQWDQARAQSAVQANQAGYAALTAPASGVVTVAEAEVGAVLSTGTPVLRLAHDGPRDAVFSVPEDQIDAWRALAGRPGAVRVRAWGDTAAQPATVREVAAAADPVTRTFQIKADLGTSARWQLGQTLTVLQASPPQAGVIRLPLSAVTQVQGATAVWVLDRQAMTVQPQPIAVGGADGNLVVVASGLQPGQTIVTAGVHTLSSGQKVKLYQAPGAGAPAGAATAVSPAPAASR